MKISTKKIRAITITITTLILSSVILSGCLKEVKTEAELLKEDAVKAYDNLKEEVDSLSTKFTETKNKVEETADEIKNAKEAVGKVFE